jgi:hypothetical protein
MVTAAKNHSMPGPPSHTTIRNLTAEIRSVYCFSTDCSRKFHAMAWQRKHRKTEATDCEVFYQTRMISR